MVLPRLGSPHCSTEKRWVMHLVLAAVVILVSASCRTVDGKEMGESLIESRMEGVVLDGSIITQRLMRGLSKSGTTMVHFAIITAIRTWLEGTETNELLSWRRFPSHTALFKGITEGISAFPGHLKLEYNHLIPGFGHGANCGKPGDPDCAGNRPEDTIMHIFPKTCRMLFLVRHPLSVVRAQFRWYYNNSQPSAEYLIKSAVCILRHYREMAHQAALHPTEVMIVKYEDFLTEKTGQNTLKRIMTHFGLNSTETSIASAIFNSKRDNMRSLEDRFSTQSEQYHYTHTGGVKLLLKKYPEAVTEQLRNYLAVSGLTRIFGYSLDKDEY